MTILILSGEGDGPGTYELYTGPITAAQIARRISEERQGGARWARALTYSHTNDHGHIYLDWLTEEYVNGPDPKAYDDKRRGGQKAYRIYSRCGIDHGAYTGASKADALAAMHRDAGYPVKVTPSGRLAFPDAETAALCGGVDQWDIVELDEPEMLTFLIGGYRVIADRKFIAAWQAGMYKPRDHQGAKLALENKKMEIVRLVSFADASNGKVPGIDSNELNNWSIDLSTIEPASGLDLPSPAAEFGRNGGKAKTAKKAKASAENGKKGGKPATDHYLVIFNRRNKGAYMLTATEKEIITAAAEAAMKAGTSLEEMAGIGWVENAQGDYEAARPWAKGEELQAAIDYNGRDGQYLIFPDTVRGARDFKAEAKRLGLAKEAADLLGPKNGRPPEKYRTEKQEVSDGLIWTFYERQADGSYAHAGKTKTKKSATRKQAIEQFEERNQ